MTLTQFALPVAATAALLMTACSPSSSSQSAGAKDLQAYEALDRTAYIFEAYGAKLEADGVETINEARYAELTEYMGMAYNSDPAVSTKTLGVAAEDDGTFTAYGDTNANNTRDAGEDTVFTVDYDEPNSRLILTDYTGESSGYRISGGGLLAGYVLGSMMNRSKRAGLASNRHSSVKNTTPRRAASRTRTGGARSGK